jgi:hypothetical protein
VTDPANATNIAIVARLRAAGLLALAERIAKREELLLHHVIAVGGDPTGGHVALWRALAAEGKDAAALSALLGWPAAVIERHVERPKPRLVPAPAPPVKLVAPLPAPAIPEPRESEERPRRLHRRRAQADVDIIEKIVGPLRVQVRTLQIALATLTARLDRSLRPDPGSVDRVLDEVAASYGITVAAMCGREKSAPMISARRTAMRRLSLELGMSPVLIARTLHRHPSTVFHHLSGGKSPKAAA